LWYNGTAYDLPMGTTPKFTIYRSGTTISVSFPLITST
jgi:hypothetical protein